MPKRLAHKHRRRPPFFRPVTLRARVDGWSHARQCEFLAQLYITGSITAAARAVGMTAKSAYRLRDRPGAESFAAAWDCVLTPPGIKRPTEPREDCRKVTTEALRQRFETGLVQPLIYRQRLVAIHQKPDNSALRRLLRRAVVPRGAGDPDRSEPSRQFEKSLGSLST